MRLNRVTYNKNIVLNENLLAKYKIDISGLEDKQNFLNKKRKTSDSKSEYLKTISKKKIEKMNYIFEKPNDMVCSNCEESTNIEVTKFLALDCEMVEIDNLTNGLARISVVNEHGDLLVNTLCKPPGVVTSYRCEITGLTPSDLENAKDYSEVRKMIVKLFKNKVLIGHSIENDLVALNYEHPKNLIRDTSKFKFFRSKINQPHSLKYLSEIYLNRTIQTDLHDSVGGCPSNFMFI